MKKISITLLSLLFFTTITPQQEPAPEPEYVAALVPDDHHAPINPVANPLDLQYMQDKYESLLELLDPSTPEFHSIFAILTPLNNILDNEGE